MAGVIRCNFHAQHVLEWGFVSDGGRGDISTVATGYRDVVRHQPVAFCMFHMRRQALNKYRFKSPIGKRGIRRRCVGQFIARMNFFCDRRPPRGR
jgi:hypothetical protein